jgi:tetratricopeptide (TPR) repeat protein
VLGELYVWKGDFNLGIEKINEASALAEETGENLWKICCLYALSYAQSSKGEYNEAISTAQKCLQLSRDCGIGYFDGPVLTTLGWIYYDLSNIELALQYHNEALKTTNVICKRELPFLVDLGVDYLYKKDYENAERYFTKANAMIPPHRGSIWRFKTRILLGFGEISLAKGDYAQALESAEEALFTSEKAGAKKYIAKSLKLKAEVLAKKGNMQEAIELMEKASKGAQELGNPPLLWQTHYSLGLLLEKNLSQQEANGHFAQATGLIEETASKLKDASLKNTLLTAPQTQATKDACARTKPT